MTNISFVIHPGYWILLPEKDVCSKWCTEYKWLCFTIIIDWKAE